MRLRFHAVLVLALVVMLLAACSDFGEVQPTPTPPQIAPTPTEMPALTPDPTPTPNHDDGSDDEDPRVWVDFDVEILATGLEVPWEIAFLPNGDIFITERPGQVRLFRDGELSPEPILIFDDVEHVPSAEAGLCGMALHPNFEDNGWIYFYYTYRNDDDEHRNRVVRYVVDGVEFNDRKVIIDDLFGAYTHNGGRMAFGPDEKLYVTIGDAQRNLEAQDIDVLVGKVLRVNDDGTIPKDNPFIDSPVYAYGLRNPQGLAWHPVTGDLYAPQHGPSGNDEINKVRPGKNYGWPHMEGLRGEWSDEFTLPLIASGTDTWAPSGATFVSGDAFPQWTNQLIIAGLRSQTLYHVDVTDDRPTMQLILQGHLGRLRTVVEGPDGFLYLITSNRDERLDPRPDDDRFVRLVPAI